MLFRSVWLNYIHVPSSLGATPVTYSLKEENDYQIDFEELESKITEKTKMIVVVNPSNPTGGIFSRKTLEKLSEIAIRNDLLVVSDEIYSQLVYDGAEHVSIASIPGMKERTITLGGFSKAYSMTGWRLGYMCALKPAAALLAFIPCLMIFPLLSPIVVLLSILLYFKESRKAEEKVTERREKIEGELPRFVATVEQELGASRDVLTILENYKRHAGPDFARELDVLTADMRSSSYEAALVRFEGRLASPMLSDIVRGLIGVLRGDDGRIYFQMLSHDMKQLELQRLKAQAAKIPPKIRVYSFVMLVCFMLIYIVIILMQILTSMGGLFG